MSQTKNFKVNPDDGWKETVTAATLLQIQVLSYGTVCVHVGENAPDSDDWDGMTLNAEREVLPLHVRPEDTVFIKCWDETDDEGEQVCIVAS